MNKLFTKIAALALGAAMAFGVGVAVSGTSKDVKPVEAANVDVAFSANDDIGGSKRSVNGSSFNFGSDTNVSVLFSKASAGTDTQYWGDGNVRCYAKSTFTVTSTGGNLTAITLTYTQTNSVSANVGTYSNKSWTGSASQVVFTIGGTSGHIRLSAISATYASSGGTTVNKTITGPSNMSKNVGDSSVDIASQIKVDGNTFSGCTVTSSNTSAVSVSGTTLSFDGAGQSTITISHANVIDGSTTYVYASATFTVTVSVVKNPLPSMPSGDYGKITSTDDLSNGYYLLVCDNSSIAYKGSASTLDQNNGTSVSISNNSIGSTSAIDAEALYIVSAGSNNYSVAAKVKYADNGYKFIGRSLDSNGTDESDSPLANTISFDGSGHALITGSGGRRLCAYSNSTFRYYSTSNTANLFLYKKGNSSATFNVTYDGNDNSSGTVPSDTTDYATGATVTVLGNTGSLTKTGFTWNGWNTAQDGSGTHYAGGATFSISGNVTLYAEWVKSLDAISAIGGTVTATLSNKGTYSWDFSNITVTGTLSGSTGQDVKTYVDLSSTTQIPSTIGSCTVSVTATKKSTVPGSATSLTNNSISGEVGAEKLTYTVVFDYTKMLTTNVSYANENANSPKVSTATCSGHDDIDIEWASYQAMRTNGSALWMQFQGSNKGHIYNTTEFPGTITDVTLTTANGSTAPFNTYYGDTEKPLESQTVGGKFFTVQVQSGTGYLEKVTVTFEVSDKPKVQLVASDINADIADGASTPVVTDGTSAVTGYTLTSEDPYVASITNDSKVQPVSYGRVKVSVSKAEDAGHIYLATTFTVIVSDHSKQVSTMEFVEAAGGSATADDGVVWTISANASENEFSEVYGINFGTNGNKVSSLTMTTPADEERIIKNVVVEAMSATDGSDIAVTVGETSFTCNKSTSVGGNVSTYNFSGNLSGAISITISGTASSKYGVKSISVLYVGDEATSFASTFLGAFSCNASGTSKPTFNMQSDGVTPWTWALLADEYNELGSTDKAKFAVGATGVSATITECVTRYDYVVGKYFKTGLDTSFTDFMSRNPSPIGSGSIVLKSVTENVNSTAIIVVTSMIGLSAVGGYFFLRKRKENI